MHFTQGSKQIIAESKKYWRASRTPTYPKFTYHIHKTSTRLYPNQMHVHVNACLNLLTSLHHSTYASMHDHIICMFMVNQRKHWRETLI